MINFIKNKKIYFLMVLFLIGINVLKNIYMEFEIQKQLEEKHLQKIETISCHGIFNLSCNLNTLVFKKKISNTNYNIDIKEIELFNLNILEWKQFKKSLNLVLKGIKISDSRGAFFLIQEPKDLNVTLMTFENTQSVKLNFVEKDLKISSSVIWKNEQIWLFNIEMDMRNNIIKKIIYELYKLKILETIESDDKDFSSTRGMNIPLGVDTKTVISEKIFFGEPYRAITILLVSEIEVSDIVFEYNQDENISNFLRDILNNNGVSRLNIKRKKDEL